MIDSRVCRSDILLKSMGSETPRFIEQNFFFVRKKIPDQLILHDARNRILSVQDLVKRNINNQNECSRTWKKSFFHLHDKSYVYFNKRNLIVKRRFRRKRSMDILYSIGSNSAERRARSNASIRFRYPKNKLRKRSRQISKIIIGFVSSRETQISIRFINNAKMIVHHRME